jgi:hypothetical protein
MILTAVLLAALSAPLQEGLDALAAERYEDAVRALEAAPDLASSYDGLVGLAVARGRMGRLSEAEAPLAQAVRLDPRRPEARVERGGLRFLQGRYADAVRDLQPALDAREDVYTRDLLGSSLLLSERVLEAVAVWNPAGRPRLATVTLRGLAHTRDLVARRELRFREGEVLDAGALRASLRALDETGIFTDVVVRGAVRQDRDLDLELLFAERHGFGHPVEVVTTTLTNLLVGRARLRYANLAGEGVTAAAFYRYEGARPRLEGSVDWPRPFGLPAQAHLAAFRERQPYAPDAESTLVEKTRGADVTFRRVLDGRTAGEAGLRWRHRSFDAPAPYAVTGSSLAALFAFDRELWTAAGQRLDAGLRGQGARDYASGLAWLRYQWSARPRDARPPRSVLAARVLGGTGTSGLPLDEMFAPGAAPDAEYPLRGHRLRDRGALGGTPIGRELGLVNVEWRFEAWSRPAFGAGVTLFEDTARVGRTAFRAGRALFDAGGGLRLRFGRTSILRIDYGRSLTDGGHAVSVGLGEAF